MSDFIRDLSAVINKYGKENDSNSPDFILAEYIEECLNSYARAVRKREVWYGREFDRGLTTTDEMVRK